jgi:hypothetical protein
MQQPVFEHKRVRLYWSTAQAHLILPRAPAPIGEIAFFKGQVVLCVLYKSGLALPYVGA